MESTLEDLPDFDQNFYFRGVSDDERQVPQPDADDPDCTTPEADGGTPPIPSNSSSPVLEYITQSNAEDFHESN